MKDKRSRLGIRIHGRVLTVLFLRILPCCTQFSTSIELRWGFLRLSHWPGCTTVKGRRSKEKRVCAKGPLACEQDYVNAPVLGTRACVCVCYIQKALIQFESHRQDNRMRADTRGNFWAKLIMSVVFRRRHYLLFRPNLV